MYCSSKLSSAFELFSNLCYESRLTERKFSLKLCKLLSFLQKLLLSTFRFVFINKITVQATANSKIVVARCGLSNALLWGKGRLNLVRPRPLLATSSEERGLEPRPRFRQRAFVVSVVLTFAIEANVFKGEAEIHHSYL